MTERLQDSGQPFRPENGPLRLVLASGSVSRARLLAAAGVDFLKAPADIDEAGLMPAEGDAAAAALALAGLKALSVSEHRPGAFVLGGDSILEFEGMRIGKSPDVTAARALLLRLFKHLPIWFRGLAPCRPRIILPPAEAWHNGLKA